MTIIHGDKQVASRDKYLELKLAAAKQGLNIIEFSCTGGDPPTLTDLIQSVESKSLFGSANAVFIDSLFSSRPSTLKKELIKYIESNQEKNIVIWEPKDVTSQLKAISSKLIAKFDLPKHIFAFLDNPSLESFQQVLKVAPVEQIFASLCTRLHKVLLGTGRFNRQFTFAQLSQMNTELLEIDYAQKTSSRPYDLTTALELWLIKLHTG